MFVVEKRERYKIKIIISQLDITQRSYGMGSYNNNFLRNSNSNFIIFFLGNIVLWAFFQATQVFFINMLFLWWSFLIIWLCDYLMTVTLFWTFRLLTNVHCLKNQITSECLFTSFIAPLERILDVGFPVYNWIFQIHICGKIFHRKCSGACPVTHGGFSSVLIHGRRVNFGC